MAEPFAAAVLQDEENVAHPPSSIIPASTYSPAWDPNHLDIGTEQQKTQNIRDTVGFGQAVSKSFTSGGNIAVQVYKDIDRIATSGPEDPTWNKGVNDFLAQNRQRINPEQDWRYRQANNAIEAQAILADAEKSAQDNDILTRRGGVSTFVAQGLAGLIDIDAPVTLMSGGLGEGGKLAISAARSMRLLGGVAKGALTGGALGAVDLGSDPNSDWTVIPTIGLMGAVFGGVGGALSKGPVAEALVSRNKALDEVGENIANGLPRAKEDLRAETFQEPDPYHSVRGREAEAQAKIDAEVAAKEAVTVSAEPVRKPGAIDINDIDRPAVDLPEIDDPYTRVPTGRAGIGANQLASQGPGIRSIQSPKLVNIIQTATTRARQLGLATDWNDGYAKIIAKAGPVGRAVSRFADVVSNSPIGSDFGRMMNTGSNVAQTVAYDLLENASGVIRNGRSAARIMEHYRQGMANAFIPFDDNYQAWGKDVHNAGFWQRATDTSLKDDFHEQVIHELQSRYHDGQSMVGVHPNVKAAADAHDNVYKLDVKISQGRPGEIGIFGTDKLVERSGYIPQRWSGLKIRNLINAGRHSRNDIVDALTEEYQGQHPTMRPADARTYADAAVHRAEINDSGANANVIGTLQGDGRLELEEYLRRQGHSQHEIEGLITRITGAIEERGKPSHTKQRLDVDFRNTSSNGIRMMDLLDTDLSTMTPNRIRKTSGLAALARKGIASRADWEDVKAAIREEQIANGKSVSSGPGAANFVNDAIDKDKHVDAKFLDGIYSYFGGGPVNGGISPTYSRIKKLTNLALLNQLGLTQLAEFGPNIAAVGVQQFFRHASNEIRDSIKNIDSPLVAEMRHMGIYQPEEKLFRDDMIHDFERGSSQGEYMRHVDRLLNKATRVQGFTSGFYAMRRAQQRIAVTSAADRLARHFRDGGLISDERIRDMGFTQNDVGRLQRYVQNGTVQFDGDGNLVKLGIDAWDHEDADIFAMSLNGITNQLVQKAMAGESSMLFHKDGVSSLFWHLKSFGMLAIEKQALRQVRIMDTEAAMTFAYGLATASAAYAVKQTINGKSDDLSWGKIARGGFAQSNMAGWIPMWTDPLAGMLGLNNLKFGGYGGQGAGQVISSPAAFSTLDRMARAPAALAHSIWNAGPSNTDINALTSTPLIGNLYGFAAIFNAMRQDPRAEARNAARTAKAEEDRAKEVDADPAAAALKAAGNTKPGGLVGVLQDALK